MAILAGQVLTAARLLNDSGSTSLTAATGIANDWADWGTETVTFPDPGTAVQVTAALSGYIERDDTPAHSVRVRVAVSFDGGATFAATNANVNDPNTDAGNVGGSAIRQNVTSHGHRQGTPTGDVVVKAQTNDVTGAAGADALSGRLTAWIHAV